MPLSYYLLLLLCLVIFFASNGKHFYFILVVFFFFLVSSGSHFSALFLSLLSSSYSYASSWFLSSYLQHVFVLVVWHLSICSVSFHCSPSIWPCCYRYLYWLLSSRCHRFFWLSLSDCHTVAAFLVSSRLGRSVVVRPLLAISIGVSLFPLSLSIFMRPSSALFDINIVVPAADRWHRYRPSVVAIRPPCRPLFVWPPQSGCSGRSQAIPALQLLSGHSLGYPTAPTALWPLW